ncbi:hypothetical protein SMITH_653 [Smithella sp. ME-1]|nr:hypothetical protein SMITH_653 [Smithella sp. ME-1]
MIFYHFRQVLSFTKINIRHAARARVREKYKGIRILTLSHKKAAINEAGRAQMPTAIFPDFSTMKLRAIDLLNCRLSYHG